MKYKFYLKPGQQGPDGTTSIAMPDGGIVWIGETWTAKDIEAHEMSAEELAKYELLLKYQQTKTEFTITFDEFKDSVKLTAAKASITNDLAKVKGKE